MAKVKQKEGGIIHGADIKFKYTTGGSRNAKKIRKKGKGSRTPGNKKRSDTCQLTSVGGLPRKAFMKARSYKLKQYPEWCDFIAKLNK